MKFTVKRSEWSRGVAAYDENNCISALFSSQSKMKCCLGFLGLACGYTERDLLDVATPGDIDMGGSLFPGFLLDDVGDSFICTEIVTINDDVKITDQVREEQLIKIFADNGIEVNFVD